MKLVNFDNPVMSSWIELNDCRIDSKPYLSGSMEAKALLAKLAALKEPLNEVTKGIFHAGREGRTYVENTECGVPFLGSTAILSGAFAKCVAL